MATKPRNTGTDKALLERDMRDINNRLTSIDQSISKIEARDTTIQTLVFKVGELEKRVEKLEGYYSTVVRVVVGGVGAALLATVVGVQLK